MATARSAASSAPRTAAPKSKSPAKVKAKPLTIQDYLQKTLTSRVYDVAIETPLDEAKSLSRRLGHHVYLKREDKQRISRRGCT